MGQPITAATALVGVLGDPVRHSLSPVMHNAALASLGVDWVYLALPAPAGRLAAVVEGLAAVGCRGLNVTIPHKQAVAALCSELSPLAERVGAVNTLVPRTEGGWLGTNTDVEGFLAPLRADGPADWSGRRAVLLGCGGSARAVVAALVELG
ncbi:MAG: shikimate dehydrogenase, partial [Prochlorococcaceae cyanobacterium]